MYCHAGLCRFGQRFSFIEYVVWGSVVKFLVRAFLVEVAQVVGNALLGLGHRLVCMSIDLLLLEAASETLHVHVARPASLAIHQDVYAA